ncbi:MAG: beta-galactosidase [Dysgonamonadaceae bacterium]|jgi:beta-galactosidase|nr:beta-galactosidase [Dysgonamonadaceae bacterium]
MKTNKLIIIYRPLLTLIVALLPLCVAGARTVAPFNEGWFFKKAENLPANLGENWLPVNIPHTWNTDDMQLQKNAFYAGEAWYKKTYTPGSGLADKRIFLRFQGVASVAEVFVNGELAGNHKGAFSAFAIEISHLLKFGEANEILVKADNSPRPDVIPINQTLFGVYGGMYRPVELIVTDKINIAVTDYASPGIYISQKNVSQKSADVSIKIKVENKNHKQADIKIITSIYESGGKLKTRSESEVAVLPQGRQTFIQPLVVKKPHLWQGLSDPYLYRTVVQLVSEGKIIDEVVQPLGLRHFELKAGGGMYLNGKKIPMYGVCRHQDRLGYGSALSDAQHDEDLAIIREVGATTIRFAHYQQAERIYAKCDSIGFVVWAEIPFVNRVSGQESENAKQQLTELIRQNYNHPSIYVWGLHNEVYSPYNYTVALTTDLNDLAKSEDPDRYTASVNGYSAVDQKANLNADIQGINRYFGWYEGKTGDLEQWISGMERDFQDYKVMLAEYGAEANIEQQTETTGDRGNYFSQFYPETFATKFHEIQWGIIAKHPWLTASYVWNTFDFATPVNTQGGVEARNLKGLVTFDRKTKKDAFYWYKANWSSEPTLYLTQRRNIIRENEITDVTVYSNCGTPKLFVNGLEIKEFKQGTTSVHFIFPNVKLKIGENRIEAKVENKNKILSDSILWLYNPDNKKEKENPVQTSENKEHSGL